MMSEARWLPLPSGGGVTRYELMVSEESLGGRVTPTDHVPIHIGQSV